ncbi:toprim domain-containing protein [Caulobacter segnis]|nr:toprim domain-containing protein [Caulobacter segnis]
MPLLDGTVEALPARGLTRETADKFGYKVGTFNGHKAHIATYCDAAGRPVAQKIRWKEDGKKQFTWVGDPKAATLYGQNLWRDAGKMVVVTEGELDALAVSQVQNNKWPVVSIPNGAGGAAKDLAKQVAWLERFEKIVLCFDMDEPGRQAVEACTKLFTPGKVYDARLPLKDACDMVKAHRSAELVDALWGSKQMRPDGIKTVADLRAKALEPTKWGLPWPWRTLTERTYGIQRHYLYSWGAGVGSGKTTTQKQLMLTAMRPDLLEPHDGLVDHLGQPLVIPAPRKVGTILFEENPAKTLRSLAGMVIGKRLNKPDVQYTEAELNEAIDSLDGLFFPLDMFGAKDWDTVKANVLYLILAEGVLDIFIDPLTALVANAEDERRALDEIMAELSGIVEAHGATIHLVSHLTTPQGTAHEEGGRVLEKHFTGSRAIARWSHAMIGLERNKQDPDAPTVVRGLKDREFGEAVGPLLGLTFDRITGRMVECPIEDGNPFRDETQNSDLCPPSAPMRQIEGSV